MGPLPDRFLAYLIDGEREAYVVGDGAIARHERQQALGSLGAIQLLAEGRPLEPGLAMRVGRLLRALAVPLAHPQPKAVRRPPELQFDVDEIVASYQRAPASEWQAAFSGLRGISGRSRPSIVVGPRSPPQRTQAHGIDLTLRPAPEDGGPELWLELELPDPEGRAAESAFALVWSGPEDPQRAPFDPAGLARLRWPTAPRNTLRIDAGDRTALFELHIAT